MNKNVIKIILLIAIIFVGLFVLTGCNKEMIDTNYTYNKAIIRIGDEIIKIDVDKWRDYEGEQLQITAKDGTIYLTSSFNTTLINEQQ